MPEDYGAQANKLTDLVQRVLESGGFSVTRELKDAPPTGYYVSYAGGDQIPVELFGPDSIRDMQSRVGPDYIGAWLDDGTVYLDHTVRFDDKNEAMQFGVDNNQQAVYDANTGAVLPVVPPFTVPGQQLPFISREYHMPDLGPKTASAPNKFVTTKEQHLRSLEIHGPVKPHHHAN